MDALKKERAVMRRAFTVKAKHIDDGLKADAVDLDELNTTVEVLSAKVERLVQLDQLILQGLLEDSSLTEDDLFSETEQADTYRHQWVKIQNEMSKVRQTEEVRSLSLCSEDHIKSLHDICSIKSCNSKRHFKLPKLELQKFDGEVKNWIAFWGQFKKIHDDDTIDNHDKFQYLIQATEKSSKARSLIESFPPSGDNYKIAIEQLKERFARDELIIEVYVRELLFLIITQAKQNHQMPLDMLYDKLNTQLRALETLGLTSDRYAAMLFPIVESALSEEVLKAWQRSHASSDKKDTSIYLNNLLEFLKFEVESNQRISLARAGFSDRDDTKSDISKVELQPTASCLVEKNKIDDKRCIWCDKSSHNSTECYKISRLTLEDRIACIKRKKACAICLRANHHASRCKSFIKCILCSKRHNVIMCPQLPSAEQKENDKVTKLNARQNTEMSLSHRDSVTILQTLLVKLVYNNKHITVRALLDNGAQRSYITKDVVEKLKLPIIGEESLGHCVFGGIETKRKVHKLYNITLLSLDDSFEFKMNVLDEHQICGMLPRVKATEICHEIKKHNINLTDICSTNPLKIDLLIGADFTGYLYTGTVIQLENGLFAIKTKLGWTIQGQKSGVNNTITTLISCNEHDISELWNLDVIGIRDPAETNSKEKIECEIIENFQKTIVINEEGRYEVHLPWKENHNSLLSNFELARKRLYSTTKRLLSTSNFELYQEIFTDWLEKGIIEEVTNDTEKGHYLAHHAVIKESSLTTRVRPVFDASAKDKYGNSLNACLQKGANLLEVIPKLLIEFRMKAIGVTSDIKKAFLQISITEKDRDYLKFLWWKDYDKKEIMTYRHRRVVFGLTPSPFLLNATIQYHLSRCPTEFKEMAAKLKNSFYVDNCVTSLEKHEVEKFIQCSKQLMLSAQFDLRGWYTTSINDSEANENTPISVLGILWDTRKDELFCHIPVCSINLKPVTKRILLSIAQKIFDPIGFTVPTLLIPKIILQKTWNLKCGWDDVLPTEISREFDNWLKEIHLLGACRIPRKLTSYPINECQRTLHVFCDASKLSYAACIFLRTEFNNNVNVQLVEAKSRIAPTKQKITIPRLELLAALIATRLCVHVKASINVECQIYYWTDSTVALTWIKKDSPWAVFVQNRVNEIREYSDTKDWHHVPGNLNPADLLSRGCNGRALMASTWWEGPSWLKTGKESWPESSSIEDDMANFELRRAAINIVNSKDRFSDELLFFSKYSKIVKMIAWILRFVNNCRLKINEDTIKLSKGISYDEFKDAEKIIWRLVQEESFGKALKKRIEGINVYEDVDSLMRVQTKLLLSNDNNSFKYPILLPDNHEIVTRLVREKHVSLQHAGVQTMMNVLREDYWILRIRRLCKKVIFQCVICKRFKANHCNTPLAPLPYNRINEYVGVFEVCGVDLAGPLYLRSSNKCYIVLFTCAVYRAVHLELTESLSTESFMMTLRRFIARRGRVSTIYSDNGTNFVGTNNLFNSINWNIVQNQSNIKQIKWIFNPPSAAWWGGWWERLVRSIKELLRRVLGKTVVTYVEMETLLCDCEAIINSRPLSYVMSDSTELTPISPNSFLQSIPHNDVTDIDNIDSNSLNKRLQYIQKLRSELRQRFKKEYLALLIHRGKEAKETLKIGDVVLIETDQKRIKWPLGLIIELYPGVDGALRVAKVRTSQGEKVRPVQRLYSLEISSDFQPQSNRLPENVESEESQEVLPPENNSYTPISTTTRCGRLVKVPQRLNL